jgi:hypothetical protein
VSSFEKARAGDSASLQISGGGKWYWAQYH